jgi:hypothetical protein
MDLIELARITDQLVVVVRVHIPIVTGSCGGDADDKRPKVKFPETGVGHPFNTLQVRRLRLSNLNVGGLVPDSAHLRLELVEHHIDRSFTRKAREGDGSESTIAGI